MIDFASDLKAAAGTPSAPLDMQAVRRRAARSRLGRWRLSACALVGLLGIGPAGMALLPASDGMGRVQTTDRDRGEKSVEATHREQRGLAGPGAQPWSKRPVHRLVGAPNALDFSSGGLPDLAGSADPDPADDEGCQAWGNLESPLVGFGAPEECTYTAKAPGGYQTSTPTWNIKIERGDRVIWLDSGTHPICGDTGTIQPGDVVTAQAYSRSTWSSAPVAVEVGSRYHC